MRPLASVIIACAIALSLGSCSDEKPPPVPPTTATTPANPDATPPPMPVRAQEDSRQGVTDFVKYYLDVFNYANHSGDTEELGRLSSPSCSACESYIEAIESLYGGGGAIEGGERTFDAAEVRFLGPDEESLVTADVAISAGTLRKSSKEQPRAIGASSMRLTFGVSGSGGERQVTRIFQGGVE